MTPHAYSHRFCLPRVSLICFAVWQRHQIFTHNIMCISISLIVISLLCTPKCFLQSHLTIASQPHPFHSFTKLSPRTPAILCQPGLRRLGVGQAGAGNEEGLVFWEREPDTEGGWQELGWRAAIVGPGSGETGKRGG